MVSRLDLEALGRLEDDDHSDEIMIMSGPPAKLDCNSMKLEFLSQFFLTTVSKKNGNFILKYVNNESFQLYYFIIFFFLISVS